MVSGTRGGRDGLREGLPTLDIEEISDVSDWFVYNQSGLRQSPPSAISDEMAILDFHSQYFLWFKSFLSS